MKFYSWNEIRWEEVNPGLSRKLITGSGVMIAQVLLRKGTLVPEHSHASEQITYILEGALQFWIEGKDFILRAGEVLVIPPNVPHKALAVEETLDLDVFSPVRQDWIEGKDDYLRNAQPHRP